MVHELGQETRVLFSAREKHNLKINAKRIKITNSQQNHSYVRQRVPNHAKRIQQYIWLFEPISPKLPKGKTSISNIEFLP